MASNSVNSCCRPAVFSTRVLVKEAKSSSSVCSNPIFRSFASANRLRPKIHYYHQCPARGRTTATMLFGSGRNLKSQNKTWHLETAAVPAQHLARAPLGKKPFYHFFSWHAFPLVQEEHRLYHSVSWRAFPLVHQKHRLHRPTAAFWARRLRALFWRRRRSEETSVHHMFIAPEKLREARSL